MAARQVCNNAICNTRYRACSLLPVTANLRYDGLLARALARELHDLLAGLPLLALALDRSTRTVALQAGAKKGPRALVLRWTLEPERGAILVERGERIRPTVSLAKATRVERVWAPADERLVVLEAVEEGEQARRVRVAFDLIPARLNGVVLGADDRVLAALRRPPLAGDLTWAWPEPTGRAGAEAELSLESWQQLLAGAEQQAEGAHRALLARIAWTSPLNAEYLLGGGRDRPADPACHERWRGLLAARGAWLVRTSHGAQPYPHPLGDAGAGPQATLLAAFASLAAGAGSAPSPLEATPARAEALLEKRIARARQRMARLEAELEGANAEAAALRRSADLLMSQLHRVAKGAERVVLDDFHGGSVEIELDPARPPAENATRMYDEARRRARAGERIPSLLESARAELQAAQSRLEALRAGSVEAGVVLEELGRTVPTGGRDDAPLPYRRYRTSGGLEVRVGRSARANDVLTFRYSAPDDVWLHARDVAGAHVVLRWPHRDANPPARDLEEAATLAALHSRARTSGTAAVDWTRRKHVRRVRRGPPGAVLVERAKTLFVVPAPELEERLRA
jgi:hypothetical protein